MFVAVSVLNIFMSVNILLKRAAHFDRGVFANVCLVLVFASKAEF